MKLVDHFERARRADLPHVGAHVRVQPRVRALPVVLRAARPARADHRRVQGRDRRARAHAGLLREHRRRRADGPQGLLGARRVRDRAPRGREVLHQRLADRRRAGGVAARRATTSTCRSRSTARPRRSTTACAASAPTRPRSRAMEHLRGHRASSSASSSRARTRRSSTRSRRSPTTTARRCGSRGCGRPAAAPTSGTSCTPRRSSSASSTSGCSRTASTVLTGDSFFHLAAYGQTLPGLNLCGAGRVVCLIDPIGDVYACPFAIHDDVPGGQRPRGRLRARVARVGAVPASCASRRRPARAASCGMYDACRGGCMAAKFFTGLPLDGPDPECVFGHGERGAARPHAPQVRRPGSTRAMVPITSSRAPATSRRSDGLVRVGRRGAAAGSPGPPAVGLQGDPRRRGARPDATGQRRRVRRARASRRTSRARRGARRRRRRSWASTSRCPCSSPPPACRPCTRRPSSRSPAPRRRAAPRSGLSGLASTAIEEVVAANPKTFAQLYWAGSREAIEARVERARAAGAAGLILTLDWTFSRTRATGARRPSRAQLDLKTMAQLAPEVLLRPRWAVPLGAGRAPARARRCPNFEGSPGFFAAYGEWMGTPPPSWEDLAWLRSLWDGPFMVKGDHARRRRAARASTTSARPRSRSPTTAATTSTARRRRSARWPRSSRRSATRPRCCSTAACAAAATSSRRSRSARAR